MTKKALLYAGACMLSLAATAATPPAKTEGYAGILINKSSTPQALKDVALCATLQGAACLVKVSVNEKDCRITVRPDSLFHRKKDEKLKIVWEIETNGWSFTQEGIKFKNDGSEFDDGGALDAGKRWKWTNKATRRGVYRYGVSVQKGEKRCQFDPGIYNDW